MHAVMMYWRKKPKKHSLNFVLISFIYKQEIQEGLVRESRLHEILVDFIFFV